MESQSKFAKAIQAFGNAKSHAYNAGIDRIKEIAREALRDDPRLHEFIMGMGVYFFTFQPIEDNVNGETAYDYNCASLDNFMNAYNDEFKFTGDPMRFTAYGELKTDW